MTIIQPFVRAVQKSLKRIMHNCLKNPAVLRDSFFTNEVNFEEFRLVDKPQKLLDSQPHLVDISLKLLDSAEKLLDSCLKTCVEGVN